MSDVSISVSNKWLSHLQTIDGLIRREYEPCKSIITCAKCAAKVHQNGGMRQGMVATRDLTNLDWNILFPPTRMIVRTVRYRDESAIGGVSVCVLKEPEEVSCMDSLFEQCFSKAPSMDTLRAIAKGSNNILLRLRDGSYAMLQRAMESDHWIAMKNVIVEIRNYGGRIVYRVKAVGSSVWNKLKQISGDVWMRLKGFANGVSYGFNWIKGGVIDCVKYSWDKVKAGLKFAVKQVIDAAKKAKELFNKALAIMAKMIQLLRKYATEIMCAVGGIVAGTAMGAAASYFGGGALVVAGTAASGAIISAAVIYGMVKVARGDQLW